MARKSDAGNPIKKGGAPKWSPKTSGSGKDSAGMTGGKDYKDQKPKPVPYAPAKSDRFGTSSEDY